EDFRRRVQKRTELFATCPANGLEIRHNSWSAVFMNVRQAIAILLSTSAFILFFSNFLCAQSREDRIAQRIEGSSTVAVRGNVHPFANAQNDRGRVSGSFRMDRITMVLKSTDAQREALEKLLEEQQDVSSPNYHRWISPEEFADRFGLSLRD